MQDLPYRIAFSRIPGIGRARMARLVAYFGDLHTAWSASQADFARAGLEGKVLQAVLSLRPKLDPETELPRLERARIRALAPEDMDFPPLLKEIDDCPPVLYVRGSLTPRDALAVAVVGTRKATAYGHQVAEDLVTGLARQGITIISGLARGIDVAAHRSAMDAGGRTVAVQACGLDMIYPSAHTALAREIVDKGCLVSDYPLGTRPRAEFFPRRNRIMSGMALGTLVIEADQESGALITARFALEQNREVLAVPGSIYSPASRGANSLIQAGAKLVTCVEDVLEELNVTAVSQPLQPAQLSLDVTPDQSRVLHHLTRQPVHIDELRQRTGMDIPALSSTLALLELSGLAKQVGAMHFVLAREVQADYFTAAT